MNKGFGDRNTPGWPGNSFLWGRILASLGRLVFHLFLTTSLLVVLGTIALVGFLKTDSKPDVDYL